MGKIKKLTVVFVATLVVLAVAMFAKAGEVITKEDSYTLDKEDVVEDNVYAAASNLNILGNVIGDLLAAGGNIFVSGTVEDDVMAAGGTINFQGSSLDDVRMAGGNLNVGGDVAGDLALAGGNVSIFSGSKIGKDLYAAGGVLEIDGEVAGEARIAGGEVRINGKISGPVTVWSDKLLVGDEAVIEGNLEYSSPIQAEISPSAQISGEVKFQELESPRVEGWQVKQFLGFAYLMKLLAFILAGIVLVVVFKNSSAEIVKRSTDGFGKEIVRGLVFLVVAPIVTLILFVSLIGFPLGILLGIFLAAAVAVACIFSGILLGAWLSKMWFKKDEIELTWKNATLGIVILSIIGFIPILGWIVGCIFFLAALGSVSHLMYEKIKA